MNSRLILNALCFGLCMLRAGASQPVQAATWDGTVASAFAGGTGTAADPYLIATPQQLAYLSEQINDGEYVLRKAYFKQTADLVLNAGVLNADGTLKGTPAQKWRPIGSSTMYPFQGYYDGAGHTISGLYVDVKSGGGLFGFIVGGSGLSPYVKNLNLADVYVKASGYAGGIAGMLSWEADIENCHVQGTVAGESEIGGIAGRMQAGGTTVSACGFAGTLDVSTEKAGGITGMMFADPAITGCYASVAFTGSGNLKGGIVGSTSASTIVSGCYYDSDKAGAVKAAGNVDASWNTDIESNYGMSTAAFSGGEVTWLLNGMQGDNPVWTQNLGTDAYPYPDSKRAPVYCTDGHYANWNGTGTAARPYLVNSPAQLKALSGYVSSGGNTVGVYWRQTADIVLNSNVLTSSGALNGTPANTWAPIGISGKAFKGHYDGMGYTVSGLYIQGEKSNAALFGYLSGYEISDKPYVRRLNVADAYVSGRSYVGAVVGMVTWGAVIEQCHASATVAGSGEGVGGIAGRITAYSSLKNCAFSGKVTGTQQYVGGVVGMAESYDTIAHCYASAVVSGTASTIGLILGYNYLDNTVVANCYYDTSKSGSIRGMGFLGSATGDDAVGTVRKSAAQFRSGEVAYLLNTDATRPVWFQKIGTDAYPLLDRQRGRVIQSGSSYTNTVIPWAAGKGTKVDPYRVADAGDLRALSEYTAAGYTTGGLYWQQTADIDLGGSSNPFTPVGTFDKSFNGSYNGGGYTISGLYVRGELQIGLFGYAQMLSGAAERPVIENIRLTGADVSGSGNFVGAIGGNITGMLVRRCMADAASRVYGNSSVGGLMGVISNSVVTDCAFMGTVTADFSHAGGITGSTGAVASSIANCYMAGFVSSVKNRMNIGSILGSLGEGNTISNSYYNSELNNGRRGVGMSLSTSSTDNGTAGLSDLTGTALTAQLGIAHWNYESGKLPVQKVFDAANNYDVIISDGVALNAIAADVSGVKVKLARRFESGKYTLMLPFALTAVQATAWGKFYALDSHDAASGTVTFAEVSGGTKANTPYIFEPADAFDEQAVEGVTLAATPDTSADATPAADMLVGSYSQVTVPVGAYGYSGNGGAFVKVGSGVVLPPLRAYLWLGSQSAAKSLHAVFTGADGIVTSVGTTAGGMLMPDIPIMHNLNGQRVSTLRHGINIINGKKVVVK